MFTLSAIISSALLLGTIPVQDPVALQAAHRKQAMEAILAAALESPVDPAKPAFPELPRLLDANDIVVRIDFMAPRDVCSSDPRVRTGVCPWACQVYLPDKRCVEFSAELVREGPTELEVRVSVIRGQSAGEGRHYILRWVGERMTVTLRSDLHIVY